MPTILIADDEAHLAQGGDELLGGLVVGLVAVPEGDDPLQLGEGGLGRHHRGMGFLPQHRNQAIDRAGVTLLDVHEDVAMRNDLALDRVQRTHCVDLGARALQVCDDAP